MQARYMQASQNQYSSMQVWLHQVIDRSIFRGAPFHRYSSIVRGAPPPMDLVPQVESRLSE